MKPPPLNGPPVDQPFVDQVTALTWTAAGHYINGDNVAYYLTTNGGTAWGLTTSPQRLTIGQASAILLHGSTANTDGTFTSRLATYELDVIAGAAKAVVYS